MRIVVNEEQAKLIRQGQDQIEVVDPSGTAIAWTGSLLRAEELEAVQRSRQRGGRHTTDQVWQQLEARRRGE